MEKKTVLQQLSDAIGALHERPEFENIKACEAINEALDLINTMLPAEKAMLEDAWNTNWMDFERYYSQFLTQPTQ